MARTALTKTTAPGDAMTAGLDPNFQAADPVNNNQVKAGGRDLILVRNTDASAHNFTLTSVPDELGRSGDLTESIPAGAQRFYGPIQSNRGWIQSDGQIYLSADAATVEIAVVALG